jgi:hypothetical protein
MSKKNHPRFADVNEFLNQKMVERALGALLAHQA